VCGCVVREKHHVSLLRTTMEYTTHDEINLVRLVRRLEKSVATPDEWKEGSGWIWLKAQKDLQVAV
jgi:hypothetical protein